MFIDHTRFHTLLAGSQQWLTRVGLFLLLLCSVAAPTAFAALDISGTTIASPARQGNYLPIEWTVANTDNFQRTGVVLTMVFPAGVNSLSDGTFGGDCPSTTCDPGETVTWALGSIPAGGVVTYRFIPSIAAATADGETISFEPTISDDQMDSASITLDIDVASTSLYDLALAEIRDPATPGSLLTYKVTFGYLQDTAAVTNSTVRVTLPAGTTFVSATGGGAHAAGVVTWPLGFLSPGDSGEREVTVQLDAGLVPGQTLRGNAEIFAVSAPLNNATVASETAIAATSGLQMAIEANPNPARPGEFLNIDVTITNSDPFTRFGVAMFAPWPQELASYSETNFDGNCASTTCDPGEFVFFTLGDIAAGGSVTTTLPPRISTLALAGSVMTFEMTAADVAGQQTRQSDSVRVESTNQFDIALAENSDPAVAGSQMTYNIHYALRADAGTVSNSVLRFALPDGVSFVAASDGGSVNGGIVSWPLGVLSPGLGGERDVTVLLDAGLPAAAVIEATATITTAAASLNAANAEANTVIGTGGGLQLAIESNVNPARTGELTNLQLIVRNSDPFERFGVSLTGIWPEGFASLGEGGFSGNCSSTTCDLGERVTWTIGDIPAGDTAVVDLPAVIQTIAADGLLANLYLQARDTLGLQTRQMQTMRVRPDTVYDLSLSEGTDPVTSGSMLDYVLAWGYREDAGAVAQTVLRMPVPDGTSFVSASGGGTLVGDTVQWPLGFLSPGDNGLRNASFAVDQTLPNGSVIEAEATMSGASSTAERLFAEALTSVTPASGLKLAIETSTDPARLNEKSNYRLTVSNSDPFARFGVQLTGRFPQDIRSLSEGQFDGDCASTTCDPSEIVFWTIGEIPAGDAKSVDLPGVMTNVGTDGILANLYAIVRDNQGAEVRQSDTLRLQSDTVYDVSLIESADPAVPGSELTYTLTWGLREDAASVRNSRLQLTLPPGVVLLSASDAFVQSGNVVTWDLGFVSPGEIGIRTATISISGGTAAGNVLEAAVDLFDITEVDEGARAEAHTVVRATAPLSLAVDATVFTALPGRSLLTRLTITNNDAFTRFDVALQARYPRNVASLSEAAPGFDGNCSSTTCDPDELVFWPLVDIPAGGSVTVALPMTASSTQVEGQLLNLYAWVEDSQGVQARGTESYPTGCIIPLDADCDGILDSEDNCLGRVNSEQIDTDGDGYGNACDADFNQDCIVNPIDLGIMRTVFFSADTLVDLDGDGTVNTVDLGILRSLFFSPPGPSALPGICD